MDEKIIQTPFSKLVREHLGTRPPPVWKRDFTSDTCVLFRVFDGTGAIQSCSRIPKLFNVFDIDRQEKTDILIECLAYLQKGEIKKIEEKVQQVWTEMENKNSNTVL
jgi:hypothetical protein